MSTEEGIERALAKLDTIKDDVIWWSAGAETPQLLADGEVVMGSTYNGRLFSVIAEQKQPVEMLWDWQVFDFDGWVVPEDLPEDRLNRVMHFLRFATDTQRLADQAKYISYGPARDSSQPLVSTHADLGIEMAPHMPTNPANQKNYPGQQHRVVGRQRGRRRSPLPELADPVDPTGGVPAAPPPSRGERHAQGLRHRPHHRPGRRRATRSTSASTRRSSSGTVAASSSAAASSEVTEGEALARHVVIEFPSYEAALRLLRRPRVPAGRRDPPRPPRTAVIIVVEGHDG